MIFPNKHPGPSRNFGLWVGGTLPRFGVFSLLGNKVSVFSLSIFTKGCLLGNMGGGGGLPERNSIMLVRTGRARVLIREYYGTWAPSTHVSGFQYQGTRYPGTLSTTHPPILHFPTTPTIHTTTNLKPPPTTLLYNLLYSEP